MVIRSLACVLVALSLTASARAAVVVIANATDTGVTVKIAHKTGKPVTATLAPGEALPFPVGRVAEVRFTAGGKDHAYQLDPYTAYVFTNQGFQGIELVAPMPKPDDVPAEPAEPKPLRIVAKLLVDEAEPRTKAAWEKALRKRAEATSALLERQVGVTVEVADVGTWTTAPAADDLQSRLADLEQAVKPTGGQLVIGFTSRPVAPGSHNLGTTRGPLHSHVLVHEGVLKTEPEAVELLFHELTHLLGAAHSPDPNSAVRPKLGDGKARSLKFRIGLDPLNIGLINRTMDAALRGHPYAKAPVDIACWDLLGKATGQPVYNLLGGKLKRMELLSARFQTSPFSFCLKLELPSPPMRKR